METGKGISIAEDGESCVGVEFGQRCAGRSTWWMTHGEWRMETKSKRWMESKGRKVGCEWRQENGG